jgi:hypothetical protein
VQKILEKKPIFAQNLENKRWAKILPCRSMVLKVVAGKILETLELCVQRLARRSVLELQAGFLAFGMNGRVQRA